MRVSACIIGAVAAKEMGAGGYPVVGHLVRQVTMITSRACTVQEQGFADGNFVGVVVEAALAAKGAGTCGVVSDDTMEITCAGFW